MTSCVFLIPGDLGLPTGGYAYDRQLLAQLGGHGIAIRHVALPGSYPAPTAADLELTRRTIREHADARAVLADGLAFGAMPADVIAAIPQPIVALCHHPLYLEAGLTGERQAELKALETAALQGAAAVIVTSAMTRRILVQEMGIASGRISVAVPGTEPAPRSLGTGRPVRILAVGAVVPRKGYRFLVEALASLESGDWGLVIAGPDDRSPETTVALRAQIAEVGLEGRIRLAGAVSEAELARLYEQADLLAMPSLFEGYGMVLAEAMARGLPIVCTTGGAAAETVPGAAAIKVAPGDATALAAALRAALEDGDLRQQMGRASWLAGQQLPRWNDTARIVAEVIKRTAG